MNASLVIVHYNATHLPDLLFSHRSDPANEHYISIFLSLRTRLPKLTSGEIQDLGRS